MEEMERYFFSSFLLVTTNVKEAVIEAWMQQAQEKVYHSYAPEVSLQQIVEDLIKDCPFWRHENPITAERSTSWTLVETDIAPVMRYRDPNYTLQWIQTCRDEVRQKLDDRQAEGAVNGSVVSGCYLTGHEISRMQAGCRPRKPHGFVRSHS